MKIRFPLLFSLLLPASPVAFAEESITPFGAVSTEQVADYVRDTLIRDGVTIESIHAMVKERPDDITGIVAGAVRAGASNDQVSKQCEYVIPARIVPKLVSSAIKQSVNASDVVKRCLKAVPVEEAFDVVAAALDSVNPGELYSMLQAVQAYFNEEGLDGTQVLVSSLIAGEYLSPSDIPENCSSQCLQDIAQGTLDFLSTLDQSAADFAGDSEVSVPDPEDPFSNS